MYRKQCYNSIQPRRGFLFWTRLPRSWHGESLVKRSFHTSVTSEKAREAEKGTRGSFGEAQCPTVCHSLALRECCEFFDEISCPNCRDEMSLVSRLDENGKPAPEGHVLGTLSYWGSSQSDTALPNKSQFDLTYGGSGSSKHSRHSHTRK